MTKPDTTFPRSKGFPVHCAVRCLLLAALLGGQRPSASGREIGRFPTPPSQAGYSTESVVASGQRGGALLPNGANLTEAFNREMGEAMEIWNAHRWGEAVERRAAQLEWQARALRTQARFLTGAAVGAGMFTVTYNVAEQAILDDPPPLDDRNAIFAYSITGVLVGVLGGRSIYLGAKARRMEREAAELRDPP